MPLSIGAIALAFLLGATPRRQDPNADLERVLDLLASEEIADRERGLEILKALDPGVLPQLRLRVGTATDAESKARLSEAIRHLTLREADRLLAEGRFTSALRMAAVADGASDPDAVVADVKSQVALEIRGRVSSCPPIDDVPEDLDAVARDLLDTYGPWGVAVLFDALSKEEGELPAARLLARLPEAVAPALRRALVSSNPGLRREACYVVYAMTFEVENLPDDGVEIADALRIASADPLTDRGTRMRIALILEKIGKTVKKSFFAPLAPVPVPSSRSDVRFLRASDP